MWVVGCRKEGSAFQRNTKKQTAVQSIHTELTERRFLSLILLVTATSASRAVNRCRREV